MSKQFEYTTLANRYTARYPFLTYIGTQVNFWIVANVLLVVVINFYSQIVSQEFNVPASEGLGNMLLVAVVFGILYGASLGMTGYYLEQKMFKRVSLGKIILVKTMGSLILLIIMLLLLRYVFFGWFVIPPQALSDKLGSETIWRNVFYLLLTYYFFMTLLINFINQINKKYGPGVLLPLLFGRYRNPKEEERIFMFMDLKSSTTIAEQLGHLKYSACIRDCFADINEVLFPFCAQVYQYVGDEVVITWPTQEGLDEHRCIRFYFACKKLFRDKAEYYLSNYGLLPEFKAGMHMGLVTVVEIGEIKRDIAYHGDTLNTAARIQSVCNQYGKSFLISEVVLNSVKPDPQLQAERLGMIALRGKTEEVGIVSINWILQQ